jgi:predicted phosphodiesterase
VILGDLHGHWDDEDERYYASLPCDLLLCTGDLADSPGRQYAVARSLARCGSTVFAVLGNHDGGPRLLAYCEAHGYRLLEWGLSFGHASRVRHLRSILGEHDVGLARRELPHLKFSRPSPPTFRCRLAE